MVDQICAHLVLTKVYCVSDFNKKHHKLSGLSSTSNEYPQFYVEVRWPSGRALDSGARGWGFDPHSGHRVVSLSKIHLPPKKYW